MGSATLPALPAFKGAPGWEFTDISKLDVDAYESAPALNAGGSDPLFPGQHAAAPLTREAADPRLGSVVTRSDYFVARNEEGWSGGSLIRVPAGERLDEAVLSHVVVPDGKWVDWRTLIVVEEGAEAEVWEQFLSESPAGEGVLNVVTEIVVEQGARLRYIGAQLLSERGWIFGSQRAIVARDGSLDWAALGFGSGGGKVFMETKLDGPGAEAKVTGAYASHARQHLDFDTLQEHAAPDTSSDLAFRGVLQDRSSAVWRGMIKVDPGAQRTDAFQESRNLLLSKKAHADAIPGLEIQADDVRCTHAAAIAQIDREQLFYLRSRGLREGSATRLVIDGFMQELVERFTDGPIRPVVAEALERRLAQLLD